MSGSSEGIEQSLGVGSASAFGDVFQQGSGTSFGSGSSPGSSSFGPSASGFGTDLSSSTEAESQFESNLGSGSASFAPSSGSTSIPSSGFDSGFKIFLQMEEIVFSIHNIKN